MPGTPANEEELLRAVAMQNAQTILLARQRAEQELVAAKQALEARTVELERANDLIRTIMENAASSLLMLDTRGIATFMNPAAIESTGYTLDEFSHAPFHDILHPKSGSAAHPIDECPIRKAREEQRPLRKHRDLFVRKDGSTFPVSCSLAPLQREGRPAGAVLEFRDITDELVAQEALEEANRRKDQFLATLSHELRTPMTAVLGWARMLKIGLSEADTHDAIEAIERNAAIQAQLIDDVLDVSRVVAGKMTFRPAPVDLSTALQAALTTVHPAAAAKGIEILSSVPPRVPRVLGDEGRLQQIIWNLLSNAVKFTPRGGTITVRLINARPLLRLTVQDTGKGIEAKYLPHVFEPFSQEDSTTTRAHEGIGLGLSIARSLVELHGGRIRVASDGAGKGTTFTVELPILEESTRKSSAVNSASADRHLVSADLPDLSGNKILIVDDQEFTRDVVTAIFRTAGAEVQSAASVREGLETFSAFEPNLVVCDLAMPEEDGYVFVKAIRALESEAHTVPIVALTAFGRPEDRQRAVTSGFDDFLKKPIDPKEMIHAVQRLLK